MAFPTYLEYTIVPNPVKTGTTDQELIILATLKTAEEVGQVDEFVLDHIKINFGTKGTEGGQLSDTVISKDNFKKESNWTASDADGTGMVVKLAPVGTYGTVQTNALTIKVKDVAVNNKPGDVSITITEVGTAYENGQPVNKHNPTTGEESLVLTKLNPSADDLPVLTATHPRIAAGHPTQLQWTNGPKGDYTLYYLDNNKLKTITNQPPDNQGALLGPDDSYPKDKAAYPLILDETTDFILEIVSGGTTNYVNFTVLVTDETLYASKVIIDGHDKSASLSIKSSQENAKVELTNAQGTWTIQTSNSNLNIQNSQGANLTLSPQGQLTVNGGINISGDATFTGNLTVEKDLNVNGNSIVDGSSIAKGRGGRTFVGSLDSRNGYSINNLFTNEHVQPFNFYELVFNSVKPNIDNDKSFGARFYGNGSGGSPFSFASNKYSSVFVGNDSGDHGFGRYKDQNYLGLWPDDRSGPTTESGLLGTMTLFRYSTLGCVANLYAPNTYDGVGCQVWVEGTLKSVDKKTVTASDIAGIEFNFYGLSGGNLSPNGIASGYIDVYGWN